MDHAPAAPPDLTLVGEVQQHDALAPSRGRAHVTCRGCHTLLTVEKYGDV